MSLRTSPGCFRSRNALRYGTALLALALCAGAWAQGSAIEEVIVTAQKREQSIQDVGIAITSFTGEQMKTLGFQQSIDIARMAPGVHTGGSIAGQNVQFTIRGVTQNDFTDSVESPIAVYLDEGYIAMGQGQVFSLFDVERVEISKGPQSTLYGRNATGGVIHFHSRKPTDEPEVYGDFTYGSYDNVKFEGALSGPITDAFSARISMLYQSHDEIIDNLYTAADAPTSPFGPFPMTGSPDGGQDMWNDSTYAFRLQGLYQPTDRVEVWVGANYSRTSVGSGPYQQSPSVPIFDQQGRLVNTVSAGPDEICEARTIGVAGCTPVPYVDGEDPGDPNVFVVLPTAAEDGVRPVPGGDFFGYVDPDGEDFDMNGDFAYEDLNKFENWAITGRLTVDFDSFSLTSVSDYKHYDKSNLMDVDAGPVPQSIFQSMADSRQFSQELRLDGETGRSRWVAGAYVLFIDNNTVNGLALPANSPLLGFAGPGLVVPFAGLDANGIIDLETESYSLFGQVEYDLTDQFMLTVGARVIEEKKDYSFGSVAFVNTDDRIIDTSIAAFPLPVDNLGNVTFADKTSKTLWAGKVQLDWTPTDDLLLYAGVNRGVKAGSFNAQLQDGSPRLSPEDIGYDEEILLNYEAGFKSTLWGGKARLNGSLFYYDYTDYQAFVFVQSGGTVSNNDAETIGGELELFANPMDGLDLLFSAAIFDAEVKDLELAPTLLIDVEPSFAPEFQFSGLARYEWPVAQGTMWVQGDFSYSDEFYYNLRNFDSQLYDDYIIGNFRVGYIANEHWSVTGFVENVADERYGVMGFDLATLCGCDEDYYGKPRWWGVNVRYDF